jgi:hypothetical protein
LRKRLRSQWFRVREIKLLLLKGRPGEEEEETVNSDLYKLKKTTILTLKWRKT